MKTYLPKVMQTADRPWYIVDAKGKVLGKLAVEIANLLRGRNRADYTPHLDLGAYVVVINAQHVSLSGSKREQKMYYSHSGYIGHLKAVSAETMLEKKPEYVIEHAVSGMLPKNKLRTDMMKRLRVFAQAEHSHEAQQPLEHTV